MISLHYAKKKDCQFVYHVRFHPEIRKNMIDQIVPAYEEHKKWYYKNYHKDMYIILLDSVKIGYIKIDENRQNDISIAILPSYQNKGYGTEGIKQFLDLSPNITVQIKKGNIASQKVFSKFVGNIKIIED